MPQPSAINYQVSERKRTPEERAYAKMSLQDYKARRALALGMQTGDPAARQEFYGMLPNSTPEQYAAMRSRVRNEISPEALASLQSQGAAKTQTAAQGGIMQVRKFAKGGLSSSQKDFVKQMAKQINSGKEITADQQARLNKIEESTGANVSPYSQAGTQTPGDPAIASASTALQNYFAKSGSGAGTGTAPGSTGPVRPARPRPVPAANR